ncbi:MAG: 50S ribosomal protein L24 [Planctomycetes bacterium]|nr:50S ribosomal protein L24 [Planctomycetota bacterium]
MRCKLRRGDTVQVVAGNEKDKRGRVLRVLREEGKILVQGVNLRYKHIRRSREHPQGGRVQKEAPIAISNVMLVDPKLDRPTRVGVRLDPAKNVRMRVSRRSGDPIGA